MTCSDKMARWSSRWRWHTGYSADSTEWCPVEPHRDVLVCGTYQLEKKDEGENLAKQRRFGRIYLFKINQETVDLHPIQTIETAGILDQKWCYHTIQGRPVLGAATSDGLLQLYQLFESNGIYDLKLWLEHSIGQDILALSLDWSTNKTASNEPMVVVSDSAGSLTLFRIIGDELRKIGFWKCHGFEAWTAAFNYWDSDVFYSGGDDCLFKSYDARVPGAAVVTNRSHEAGVTAVRSHLDVEHQLLTGSYDEKVRLWDTRSLKRCVSEGEGGGGVWRLRWHPRGARAALAACMRGGLRLLRAGAGPRLAVLCEYRGHESIAYGADWKFDGSGLVASCSFYDCSMHIGHVELGDHL